VGLAPPRWQRRHRSYGPTRWWCGHRFHPAARAPSLSPAFPEGRCSSPAAAWVHLRGCSAGLIPACIDLFSLTKYYSFYQLRTIHLTSRTTFKSRVALLPPGGGTGAPSASLPALRRQEQSNSLIPRDETKQRREELAAMRVNLMALLIDPRNREEGRH
jgi:hypothetical protein